MHHDLQLWNQRNPIRRAKLIEVAGGDSSVVVEIEGDAGLAVGVDKTRKVGGIYLAITIDIAEQAMECERKITSANSIANMILRQALTPYDCRPSIGDGNKWNPCRTRNSL